MWSTCAFSFTHFVECFNPSSIMSSSASSLPVPKRERSSNMEALRVLAMFFVLVVHADFAALGYPTIANLTHHPEERIALSLVEYLSVVCVDVFVMLSGWFGIRARIRGVARLLFQVFFVTSVVIAGFAIYKGGWPDTPDKLWDSYFGYWFVYAYLVLYLLSPVLNAFVERASQREFLGVLVAFFTVQTLGIWQLSGVFQQGYGTLSFIGLYLLARYLRLYVADRLIAPKAFFFLGYVLCALVQRVLLLLFVLSGDKEIVHEFNRFSTNYTNPFVILGSCFLLLFFSRLNFRSRLINWLAAGSLSVYVVHQNLLARPVFKEAVVHLHKEFEPLLFALLTLLSLVGVYVVSVLVDQVRAWSWQGLETAVGRAKSWQKGRREQPAEAEQPSSHQSQ